MCHVDTCSLSGSVTAVSRARHGGVVSALLIGALLATVLPAIAAAAPAGTIVLSGHVSLGNPAVSAGLNEVGIALRIALSSQWTTTSDLAKTDANGDYQIVVDAPATLALNFNYHGTGSFVDGTTSTSSNRSDPVLQYTSDTSGIDFTLLPGAAIGGTIVDSGGNPQLGVTAIAHREGSLSGERSYTADSDAAGHYLVVGLPAGDYRVQFSDDRMAGPGPNPQLFAKQWWQSSALNRAGAPPFSLSVGQAVDGVDMTMIRPGYESIVVNCESCTEQFLSNTSVFYRLEMKTGAQEWVSASSLSSTLPTVQGQMRDLYPGTYRLRVDIDNARYQPVVTPEFVLAEGETRVDQVTVPLSPGYQSSISGRVTLEAGSMAVTVSAYRPDPAAGGWTVAGQVSADPATGNFQIRNLPSNTYTVRFAVSSSPAQVQGEWWNDQRFQDGANTFTVGENEDVAGIDATLTTSGPPAAVGRIAGADRFQTSAQIAQLFTATGGVVYVANGMSYPDAVSATAAAARWDAPLLLTRRDFLPDSIRNEILRLKPSQIIVVGGVGVVSDSVYQELDALTDGSIKRISGSNRYATSRAIASDAFGSLGGAYAIIATGRSFADALSAGAAANQVHAPVILVDGSKSHLDEATKELLLSLRPWLDRVYIAGGTGVVSSGIQADLDALGIPEPSIRLGGADRYETSVLINQAFFGGASTVYFTTGTGFADALSGSALAAHTQSPLFLVRHTCVPAQVLSTAQAFNLERIELLGGTGSLSTQVAQLRTCP